MREYQNEHTLANLIRMTRDQYIGSFLIVEGDTDGRVYKNFVDDDKCRIIVAYNKSNATKALAVLESSGFSGFLAVVDADFDVLAGQFPASQNILFTDTHDLETMIIKSPALEKILTEFGSEDKIAAFGIKYGQDVRSKLIECGMLMGYLRWLSLSENLGLKFEDLDFNCFFNDRSSTIAANAKQMITTVKNKSQKLGLKEADIQNKIEQLKNPAHDPWHVCCGHDLVCLLSLWLRTVIGSNNSNDVKPDLIEKCLRLAYEMSHFRTTQLHASIQEWEKTNKPFMILTTI